MANTLVSFFQGFSKLNRSERLKRLVSMGLLTADDVRFLQHSEGIDPQLAENFIENVIGYFPMPLGVATNFCIDGQDYIIPMAVEETSIIAAASKTARWIRQQGRLTTETLGQFSIGQVQIARVKNPVALKQCLDSHSQSFIDILNNDLLKTMVERGGGLKEIKLRLLTRPDGDSMAIIHLYIDTKDAMGANIINQACEAFKPLLEKHSEETVSICILSNLVDTKLTRATVRLKNIDPSLGFAIEEASIFAETDPYRAATHNKGVLNGIDPILIATGNDWRAVEAGIHAYAAKDHHYRAITQWRYQDNELVGIFEAPICVGVVGGVTRLHPTARLCLKMLKVNHAEELARIIAAVGLVQNLGALRALTTEGIIQGHMKLHISNLSLEAGAKAKEMPLLQKKLEELLKFSQRITLSNAREILSEIRHNRHETGLEIET